MGQFARQSDSSDTIYFVLRIQFSNWPRWLVDLCVSTMWGEEMEREPNKKYDFCSIYYQFAKDFEKGRNIVRHKFA